MPDTTLSLRQRVRQPTTAELDAIPWLKLLDGAQRERAVMTLEVADADPGERLCRIGRPANFWFGVVDGLLKMNNDDSLGAAVTFTAPSIATQMPLASGGDFAVVYASTPAAATASVFTVRVTDANGLFSDIPLTVTVNAFKAGTLNDAAGRTWREEFR